MKNLLELVRISLRFHIVWKLLILPRPTSEHSRERPGTVYQHRCFWNIVTWIGSQKLRWLSSQPYLIVSGCHDHRRCKQRSTPPKRRNWTLKVPLWPQETTCLLPGALLPLVTLHGQRTNDYACAPRLHRLLQAHPPALLQAHHPALLQAHPPPLLRITHRYMHRRTLTREETQEQRQKKKENKPILTVSHTTTPSSRRLWCNTYIAVLSRSWQSMLWLFCDD